MGILKIVIVIPAVYTRFFEFLHVDIAWAHTVRPWSRQPNDVMSEIKCAQLHNELLGRRHSTLQSHGLFALAKHLSYKDAVNSGTLDFSNDNVCACAVSTLIPLPVANLSPEMDSATPISYKTRTFNL